MAGIDLNLHVAPQQPIDREASISLRFLHVLDLLVLLTSISISSSSSSSSSSSLKNSPSFLSFTSSSPTLNTISAISVISFSPIFSIKQTKFKNDTRLNLTDLAFALMGPASGSAYR
ncbi:hypothetical protein Syun_026900 [Stephania yunnanensis]|uniref:Uncharacterized protein n=1 Tax=Stephania yunnanensis TaxID=152371 RepID=A0AAP0END8_9MAGN